MVNWLKFSVIFVDLMITKICHKIFLTAAQSTGLNTSQSQINNEPQRVSKIKHTWSALWYFRACRSTRGLIDKLTLSG